MGADDALGLAHIVAKLLHQTVDAGERPGITQALHEINGEGAAVQVAFEIN